MATACLLGIDVGTTGAKTALFDLEGTPLASVTVEWPLYHPRPGWAEQRPEDWWQGTCESIRRALQQAALPAEAVHGIGLSGQMHGAVLLDARGEVLRPAIIWSDQRTAAQCDWLNRHVGAERLARIARNPALTGFTAPKLLWTRDNEPELWQRIYTVLLPKDYVRYRLTGELAAEVSDAAGTLFLDVAARRWSDELLDAMGIPRSWMPPLYESVDLAGRVTSEAASATGLAAGTPVAAGGADNTCGAVGTGIVREGMALSSLGTSGIIFAQTDRVQTDPGQRVHTFAHSVPGRWYLMAVTQAAGLSLRWLRDRLGFTSVDGRDPYELMLALAADVPPGAEGLLWLPYLQGERTPHLDPFARGALLGLTARHDRPHLIRAVLEGVVYSLRDGLEIIRGLGIDVRQARATGGGARSRLWRQMQADVLQVEIVSVNAQEGPAFGAALLAGVATGAYPSVEAACDATIREVERLAPNPELAPVYDRYYQAYRAAYPALRELSHTLAQLAAQ